MTFKFKMPKYGAFNHYCGDCRHYKFREQVGCAYLGTCEAIEGDPTETDAYDPPCGLWKTKKKEKAE